MLTVEVKINGHLMAKASAVNVSDSDTVGQYDVITTEDFLDFIANRQRRAAARDGWKFVPAEPTEAMWKAGSLAFYAHKGDVMASRLPDVYRAMVAAAPATAVSPGVSGGNGSNR